MASSPPLTRVSGRIEYIDGLRALAVLSVVAFHASLGGAATGLLRFVSLQGCHGVDLFFVLSGFCLSYPTLERLRRGEASFNWMRYASRRLVRIVPPYYVAVAILAGLFLIFHYVPGAMPGVTWPQILRQALFIDGGTSFLNPSFWTLPIEFRWYFVFPFALWLWTRSPRAFLGAMVCCGLLVATMKEAGDLTVLPGFLLGIIAADLRTRRLQTAWLALPACVAMFAVCFWLFPNRSGHGEVGPAWEIASFFLVIAAGAVPAVERALSLRAFVAVGVASYGIYLVHQPVIVLMEKMGWLPLAAASAGVGAGFVFWWLAERPFVSGKARAVMLQFLDRRASQMAAYVYDRKFTFERAALRPAAIAAGDCTDQKCM